MRISFKDGNGDNDVALSSLAIDAELLSLNIRPTRRRRAAMRSWLAIEGDKSFDADRAGVPLNLN